MLRVVLAVLLYPIVAVMSFLPFGNDGTTLTGVIVAASLNAAYGLAFGWRCVWLPPVVFGAWYLSVEGNCEDCGGIFRDVGAVSLLFAAIGAALRQMLTRLLRSEPAARAVQHAPGSGGPQAPQ
jgi:hypothetical protein